MSESSGSNNNSGKLAKHRSEAQGVPEFVAQPRHTTASTTPAAAGSDDDISEIRRPFGDCLEAEDHSTTRTSGDNQDTIGEGRRITAADGLRLRNVQPHSEPAYVSPIPKTPSIPPVPKPAVSDSNIPSLHRPMIPKWVMASLIGKRIDEYGDVVDDNGKVLGRVAGDLPSMVGRTVLNQRGDVLGDDGELLGYVAEVAGLKTETKGKGKDQQQQRSRRTTQESDNDDEGGDDDYIPPPPESIDQFIGRSSSCLQVDHRGNILDSYGNIIGHFRDNLKNPRPPSPQPNPPAENKEPSPSRAEDTRGPTSSGGGGDKGGPRHPRDFPEGRQNAASWRKENESPSDIFMDVKSTSEGIQLTIRIPTVFPAGVSRG